MNEFAMKMRIWLRAEMTLFKAEANRRSTQAILAAISLGCVLVALIFVNMGAFFVLTESEIDSRAAFILAGVNLALAVVPFLMRRQTKPGAEEQMIREIREMALEEITKDANEVAAGFASLGESVNQLKSAVSSFSGGGFGLGPALTFAIDLLKKGKK